MKINFRYFWLSLLLNFQAILLLAQAPEAVNYQAVARNASGQLIASGSISGKFVIRLGGLSGTLAYEETFSTQTNAFGVFSVKIGEGTPLSGTFNSIAWSEQSTFLEVWLDVNGGTNYQLLSQSQFVSVPYALSAKHVSDASNIQLSDLGDVEGQPNNGQVLQWNGAAWVPATVDAGTNGVDGRTILNGTSNPTAAEGAIGDFFINTTTDQIFGPKTAGGWGTGTSLVGPAGPAGSVNASGTTNTVAKFTGTTSLGNSSMADNGTSVGIGVSTMPAESKLVVGAVNNTSEGGQIQLNAPGGTYTVSHFMDNYENRFRIMSGDNSGSSITRLAIDEEGNVGIGVFDPASKLQVAAGSSTALELEGAIKVSGVAANRPAFQVTTPAAPNSSNYFQITAEIPPTGFYYALNNQFCNNDPNCLIYLTALDALPGSYSVVYLTTSSNGLIPNRWYIYSTTNFSNRKFNVLIIKN